MMNLSDSYDPALDETELITPAAKRPRTADVVARSLEISPPPIVGPQTVASCNASFLLV